MVRVMSPRAYCLVPVCRSGGVDESTKVLVAVWVVPEPGCLTADTTGGRRVLVKKYLVLLEFMLERAETRGVAFPSRNSA